MSVGKNSLARAAKQVAEQKKPTTVAKTTQTKKTPTPQKPKTDVEALPIEVLSEKVPADEVSRPAIPAVPDMPFVGDPLSVQKVGDETVQADSVSPESTDAHPIGEELPYYLL